MGTTFVGVEGNGFWMRDSVLEMWLCLAALHVEDTKEDQSLAHSIRNEWLLASRGYFNGCIPFFLEENIATEEGKAIVLKAFESLVVALRNGPGQLNCGVLNLMGMEGAFTRDLEAWRLIEVGESLIHLIGGRKFSGPQDASFMPGSR